MNIQLANTYDSARNVGVIESYIRALKDIEDEKYECFIHIDDCSLQYLDNCQCSNKATFYPLTSDTIHLKDLMYPRNVEYNFDLDECNNIEKALLPIFTMFGEHIDEWAIVGGYFTKYVDNEWKARFPSKWQEFYDNRRINVIITCINLASCANAIEYLRGVADGQYDPSSDVPTTHFTYTWQNDGYMFTITLYSNNIGVYERVARFDIDACKIMYAYGKIYVYELLFEKLRNYANTGCTADPRVLNVLRRVKYAMKGFPTGLNIVDINPNHLSI